MNENNEITNKPGSSSHTSQAPTKHSSLAPFMAGLFSGFLVVIGVAAGITYYWYSSKHPLLQKMEKLQAQRMQEQIDQQTLMFKGLLSRLSESQLAKFENLMASTEAQLDKNFDRELADLINARVDQLISQISPYNAEAAKHAYDKANELLRDGYLEKAGIYFSNAVQHDPGNWEEIDRYSSALIVWVKEHFEEREIDFSLQVLQDLDDFLTRRLIDLPPESLDDADALTTELRSAQTALEQALLAKRKLEARDLASALKDLVDQKIPESEGAIKGYLGELDDLQSSLDSVFDTSDSEYVSLLERAAEKRETVASNLEFSAVIREVRDGLALAEMDSLSQQMRWSYLLQSESRVNQLVAASFAAPSIGPTLREQAQQLSAEIQQRRDILAKEFSNQLFQQIQEREKDLAIYFDVSAITTEICSSGIPELQNFYADVSNQSAQLSDKDDAQDADVLLKEINTAIKEIDRKIRQKYDLWAVEKLRTFFDQNKEQLKPLKNTNEKALERELKSELGDIDTNLLSYPASLTFTEVFNLFYQTLENEQKVELTAALAGMAKRDLCEVAGD